VRFHIDAELAGRRFDTVMLDIGFGDPELFAPTLLSPPPLLAFADIETPQIPVVPLEQHVAEKVHAYTRQYRGGGSTRIKDLVDLVLLLEHETFTAGRLRHALDATFEVRGTHDLPDAFPRPPNTWRTPFARLAGEVGVAPDLDAAHGRVAAFLNPVLSGQVIEAAWDNHAEVWNVRPVNAN
jgi:hypothetical protein